jgi:hypothetical protein
MNARVGDRMKQGSTPILGKKMAKEKGRVCIKI